MGDMADLFTPQQRRGGPAYGHKCLVGNWSEDLETEESIFKDYMMKKDSNTLKTTGAADKLAMSFAAVQRAHCPDKQIHYGDFIGLASEGTRGVLAADPDERSGVFACTTHAKATQMPTCRNTFRVICHEVLLRDRLFNKPVCMLTMPLLQGSTKMYCDMATK